MWVNPISMKGPAEAVHGWMLIGCALNILLLGVTFTQVYMYYMEYKSDRPWIKILVASVLFLDIVNSVSLFIFLYRSLIIFFGNYDALSKGDWILATDAWTTGVIACIVQSFFAWRVYMLTRKWIYVVIIVSLAVTGAASGIATTVQTGISRPFVEFVDVKVTVTTWLVSEVVADIIITVVLVWYLRKHKDGFSRSDMIVDRIIRVTLQTGLITMIVASVDLFFFLFDSTGTHFLFNFPLSKLYANSLMSSLNSRREWKFSGISHVGSGTRSETQGITTSLVQRHRRISTVPMPLDISFEVSSVQLESQELHEIQTVEKAYNRSHTTLHHVRPPASREIDEENWVTSRSQWIR